MTVQVPECVISHEEEGVLEEDVTLKVCRSGRGLWNARQWVHPVEVGSCFHQVVSSKLERPPPRLAVDRGDIGGRLGFMALQCTAGRKEGYAQDWTVTN